MRKLLFAIAASGAVMITPAFAQVHIDTDHGDFRFGIGPRHEWRDRDHWRGDYAYDCRVVRERTETPSGRVIIQTRREC
jgi:hypothetical protein